MGIRLVQRVGKQQELPTVWLHDAGFGHRSLAHFAVLHSTGLCCWAAGGLGGAVLSQQIARRARWAKFFPISPHVSPPFPNFGPRVGGPREGRGDVAFPPARGPPRRQGLGSLGWRRE